jgi:hypothetical protein
MSTSEKKQNQKASSNKGNLQTLEKLIGVAFTKLKSFWRNQSAHTGIQFFIESDD